MPYPETVKRLTRLIEKLKNRDKQKLDIGLEDISALENAANILSDKPICISHPESHDHPAKGDFVEYRCPRCGKRIASGFYYLPINGFIRETKHCFDCGQGINYDTIQNKKGETL